jgi:hypothetical protein
VDVDMQSALDRLMDDIAAGSAGKPSLSSTARRKGSMRVEDLTRGVKAGRFGIGDDSGDSVFLHEQMFGMGRLRALPLGRASTEPDLFTSAPNSQTASRSTIPLPKTPSAPASSLSLRKDVKHAGGRKMRVWGIIRFPKWSVMYNI